MILPSPEMKNLNPSIGVGKSKMANGFPIG